MPDGGAVPLLDNSSTKALDGMRVHVDSNIREREPTDHGVEQAPIHAADLENDVIKRRSLRCDVVFDPTVLRNPLRIPGGVD